MFRGVNRGRIFLDDNDNYRWRPHRVSASMDDAPFMDRAFVLSQFSATRRKAVYGYRRFMEEGIAMGRKPELVGGGLIRSLGGWSQVRSAGSKGAGKGDERIPGSPRFDIIRIHISTICESLIAELSLKRIKTDKWFNSLLFLAQFDDSILFHVF